MFPSAEAGGGDRYTKEKLVITEEEGHIRSHLHLGTEANLSNFDSIFSGGQRNCFVYLLFFL